MKIYKATVEVNGNFETFASTSRTAVLADAALFIGSCVSDESWTEATYVTMRLSHYLKVDAS